MYVEPSNLYTYRWNYVCMYVKHSNNASHTCMGVCACMCVGIRMDICTFTLWALIGVYVYVCVYSVKRTCINLYNMYACVY